MIKELAVFHFKRLYGYEFRDRALSFHTEQENAIFESKLQRCKRYLEWGAGASTVVAGELGVNTISIESDEIFLKAVARSLSKHDVSKNIELIHRDIGLIGPWGSPVAVWFAPVTSTRADKFRRYSDPPNFDSREDFPDLILIDGKFRVACALKILRKFAGLRYRDYELVIDDYWGRPQYHVLSKIFDLKVAYTEMAVFTPPEGVDIRLLESLIASYELTAD
jgi:hypothetical protein